MSIPMTGIGMKPVMVIIMIITTTTTMATLTTKSARHAAMPTHPIQN